MTRSVPGSIATMAAGSARTFAWAVKITRKDGEVVRYAAAREAVELEGEAYAAAPGFEISRLTRTLGYSVDTATLTVFPNDDMTRLAFLAGRWRGARVEPVQFDWQHPEYGVVRWPAMRIGKAKQLFGGGVEIEIRDQRVMLMQDLTRYTGQACPYRLGGPGCLVDLAPFTHTFTVTSVQSDRQFTCSGLLQADDYFTEGLVLWDAPSPYADVGRDLRILEHDAGGVITLDEFMVGGISVGWTGTAIAGCLRRRDEDCRVKFNNVLRFGGQRGVSPQELVGEAA